MTEAALRDDLPKLEKYQLFEEIGHGGMATVYRAKDLRLGREVAVKIIHRHLRDNREVATRFIAEARAAAKLKHKGIVEVYDVSGEEDRERFLVVELVKGATLRKVLQEDRDMPAEIGAAIVIELCDALEHAHESGIIHRDIKPENVLVGLVDRERTDESTSKREPITRSEERDTPAPSGDPPPSSDAPSGDRRAPRSVPPTSSGARDSQKRPPSSRSPRSKPPGVTLKITDFGIAKILDAQGVTFTGQVLGSPAHMAPEQIEGGEVDARTDVFALGVVLYECMVGHLPFDGKSPAQVLRRVLDGKFASADVERPAVGGPFARIVERALATDPNDRPATPTALAELLRAELAALGLENPRAEIERYFEDRASYAESLKKKLVTSLVVRAEEARRNKRTADAAADFNRAHALAPDDLVILKRMTQLGRGERTWRTQKRVALVVAASLGLGGVAYSVVRSLRDDDGRRGPPSTLAGRSAGPPFSRARVLASERRAFIPAKAELSSKASAEASSDPATSAQPRASATAPPVAGERLVGFIVNPKGAVLSISGRTIDHTSAVMPFAHGKHTATLSPQPGDRSFSESTIGFTVEPRKDGDPEVQKIGLSPAFKGARVNLLAPAGGQALCGALKLGAGWNDVPMSGALIERSCQFIAPDRQTKKAFVSIKAGEDNVVAWPAGS